MNLTKDKVTLKTIFAMQSRYLPNFLWLLLLYVLVILALLGMGEEKFEHLHLVLDISNAILSLLLMLFLLGEQHQIPPNVRQYLAIGFGFAAATELLHALIGIEWSGWFAWVQIYSGTLRPATWPPSTYVLPLAMAWTFGLMRRNSALRPALFAAGIALLTAGIFVLSLVLPRYADTGILGVQRPTQVPLLLLWVGVIVVYWRERRTHPLFEGLALMGVVLFLSDLCILYSTSPHEKFTMMAHAGKVIAYTLLHVIQMRIAAEDSRGRSAAESALLLEKEHLQGVLNKLALNNQVLQQISNETKEAQERFELIFNASPDAAVISRLQDGCITNINDAFTRLSGYTMEEAIGSSTIGLNLWVNQGDREKFVNELRTKGVCENLEAQFQIKDGKQYTGLLSAKIAFLHGVQHIVSITRDITERKQAEAEFRIAATAFESQDGMAITDANNVILRVNHAFSEITGYASEEAVGKTTSLLKSGRHDADFYASMWKSILRTGAWHGEIWNKRKNGEIYPEQLTVTAVKKDTGETTNYVAALRDITERKQAEEQIRTLAFYDSLTQLPNRRLLNDRLGKAMAANKRSGRHGALMFLDLDNFKPLNDTHGHAVGDLLLIEVAHRLTSCVREVDTVARFGGDEFVVMLCELDVDKIKSTAQADIVAEKIRRTLAKSYLLKIQQAGNTETAIEHHCAASIGVVVFNSTTSAEDVLKWADIAMYQAKERGRNRVHFFDSKS